ncbi:protein of unassigned function [Methylobacterium oryzae CBMB20]|uniref:Protein of unassigned function n=1 Tax=Methylobacterium oryzae CBMB20 TaxID=693986 RepID=A0A089NW44_9HYPH|nr:protein of unassigned function [Methylobacterium oryzae CBMB20]
MRVSPSWGCLWESSRALGRAAAEHSGARHRRGSGQAMFGAAD